MRRGTPAAIMFGKSLLMFRKDAGLSMRQVADRMNVFPAAVSQAEKGERAVKESSIKAWADALGVREGYLTRLWHEVQAEKDPPIIRKRSKSTTSMELEAVIASLTGPERDRVLGYVSALLENRNN